MVLARAAPEAPVVLRRLNRTEYENTLLGVQTPFPSLSVSAESFGLSWRRSAAPRQQCACVGRGGTRMA